MANPAIIAPDWLSRYPEDHLCGQWPQTIHVSLGEVSSRGQRVSVTAPSAASTWGQAPPGLYPNAPVLCSTVKPVH